jgi:hypothetical protein
MPCLRGRALVLDVNTNDRPYPQICGAMMLRPMVMLWDIEDDLSGSGGGVNSINECGPHEDDR